MPKISKLLRIFFPLVLVSIAVILCIRNYTPGTYLIGWDSMHPEFNFPLNVSRMLSHVWGSEMGVGAISAHSDMSDLPRIVFLWISSVVLPASFIRYFYIFSCLIIGPLGVYTFLKYVFQRQKDSAWVYPAAFLGGLFYLLNLGTLQNFYVPLEMFTVAFAGLPWLTFFALKYLRDGKKGNLLLFLLSVILISPMAYAATQAYVIYLGLFLFLFSFSLFSSGKKLKLKRFFILGILTLLLNLYWILPSVYSVIQQSLTISNANINRLFSTESFLRNADYGDIKDVSIQKSFLFGWRNFDFSSGSFKDLLGSWSSHLATVPVTLLGYILFFLAALGIFTSFVKREKVSLSFTPPLLLSLFFLFNINPPFGSIYQYLYNHFGIFSEGFRTPFTKFSVLFEFILSFYFGYFCFSLFTLKVKFISFFKILTATWLIGGIIIFALPAFNGQLIGPNVRVSLPTEYSELFSWFNTSPEGRISLMPINTKFGWEYRDWGYEGSGFLTYGIKNPILYRDFDRWNSANEDFFNQASFSLYAGNDEDFVATLRKYQVKYILLDESIVNAGGSSDILMIPQIKSITEKYRMTPVANFGFLTVYDTGFGSEIISAPESYTEVNTNLSYSPMDPLYKSYGDYVREGSINYPFISLDKRSGVGIKLRSGDVEFKNNLFSTTLSLPATGSAVADLSVNQGFDKAFNCDLKKLGTVSKEIMSSGIVYRASGGGASCDYISFPDLKYFQGYVLHINGQNMLGRSLKIYLFDSNSQMPYLEEILPNGDFDELYFVYPRNLDGKGYILNFETRSFGRVPSENILKDIEFYPVDYDKISAPIMGPGEAVEKINNELVINNVQKYGSSGYKIDIFGRGMIELNQGFDKGWMAFQVEDSRLKILPHTTVNSWANGWIIPGGNTVYIFYWPQLLEWGGGLLGILTFLFLLIPFPKRSKI